MNRKLVLYIFLGLMIGAAFCVAISKGFDHVARNIALGSIGGISTGCSLQPSLIKGGKNSQPVER